MPLRGPVGWRAGPGRAKPRTAGDAAIVLARLEPPPERPGVTRWPSRLLAAGPGISDVTVARAWREWKPQPWRTESFRFSAGPQLEAKARGVTGLYLDPPDKAAVLCADGKPQTQALERKTPVLPPRPGIPGKRSRGSIRHGTASLFAALEAATGKVTGACCPQHRHQEFPQFPRQAAKACPRVPLHTAVGNYGTRNHPDVRAWPAKRPRITLHFTPASGSWLNLVEVFFPVITRQAIRRGSFTPVKDLIAATGAFTDGWDDRCRPCTRTKAADEMLPHCRPGKRTSLTAH